jgi:hypothetical protein
VSKSFGTPLFENKIDNSLVGVPGSAEALILAHDGIIERMVAVFQMISFFVRIYSSHAATLLDAIRYNDALHSDFKLCGFK